MQSLDEHQIEYLLYKQNSQVFQAPKAIPIYTSRLAIKAIREDQCYCSEHIAIIASYIAS